MTVCRRPVPWRRSRLGRFALVLMLGPLLGGTAVPAQQQPAPLATFTAAVELVAVDFLAVTADGRPVPNLESGDIKLTVDGRLRSIRDLQFVRVAPDEAGGVAAGTEKTPTALPFATNRAGELGRTVVFLFDDNSIRPGDERSARESAEKILDRLAPSDRVVLATAARVEVDLTTDRARVRAALKNILGHGGFGVGQRVAGTSLTQVGPVLGWLRAFLTNLKAIDGPKTVIFVSGGVPGWSTSPSVTDDYAEVAKAAGASSSQLYIIQPHGFAFDASLTGDDVGATLGSMADPAAVADYAASIDDQLIGLQDLAAITGGELFRLSGSADQVFQRVVRQSSAYYLLGFVPEAGERDGRSHRIKIQVLRPDVAIRARPEFSIPKSRSTAPASNGPALPVMLKDSKAYRDLPLRAGAYVARPQAKGDVSLVIVVESLDASTPLREVAMGLVNVATGRMAVAWPVPPASVVNTRAISGTVAPAGAYRLRVAAISQDGRRGAVDLEFKADLTPAPPVRLGDLMVGQGQPDGSFVPELSFDDRAAATGYLELDGPLPKGTAISVMFELASSADEPAFFEVPGLVGGTASRDRWTARGAIPIGSVPPGDYVVRAIIRVNDEIVGRVLRTLRKAK